LGRRVHLLHSLAHTCGDLELKGEHPVRRHSQEITRNRENAPGHSRMGCNKKTREVAVGWWRGGGAKTHLPSRSSSHRPLHRALTSATSRSKHVEAASRRRSNRLMVSWHRVTSTLRMVSWASCCGLAGRTWGTRAPPPRVGYPHADHGATGHRCKAGRYMGVGAQRQPNSVLPGRG
jgi:hypothetical protein